jgi:hypothetical protein
MVISRISQGSLQTVEDFLGSILRRHIGSRTANNHKEFVQSYIMPPNGYTVELRDNPLHLTFFVSLSKKNKRESKEGMSYTNHICHS